MYKSQEINYIRLLTTRPGVMAEIVLYLLYISTNNISKAVPHHPLQRSTLHCIEYTKIHLRPFVLRRLST
jgi:hypothetical protein